MAPSTISTLSYDSVLSTTLFNYWKTQGDAISTANAFFNVMKSSGLYQTIDDIGDRMQVPLMYELGNADSYSGYDVLDVTPADGMTSAFWTWAQASVPISISALERKKNSGDAKIIDLLEAKTKQARLGLQEFFSKGFFQGNGITTATAITSPYTSNMNGSAFVDPLPLLVKYDPTTATTVGNIAQGTYAWWQNQYQTSTASTFKGFLKEMRHLRNLCSKGPGGPPDLFVSDQSYYELYEAALAAAHMNPSYQKADIPFDNVAFYGKPLTWDEFVPNASGGTRVQSTAAGTCYMLNTQFFSIKAHSGTDFAPTPFVTPNDQDASTSHILWLGGIGMSNRRKQGVHSAVDTTIAA